MLASLRRSYVLYASVAVGLGGAVAPVQAAEQKRASGMSPALCGAGDIREPGIQGDVPAGATPNYNCGVKVIGQLPRAGNVQGVGKCAYLRPRGGGNQIFVIDVSDPTRPVEVKSIPTHGVQSETMRVNIAPNRALLVSGGSVYDIKDCLNPVLLGEIKWPAVGLPGFGKRQLPHDIRINHANTKVYASFGLWEVDLSNLADPATWKITDRRCQLAVQQAGPWKQIHQRTADTGSTLCEDAKLPNPQGADYSLAASPLQASLIWPTLSHSPDLNAEDTRLYLGDQGGGNSGVFSGEPKVRIIDITQNPPKIIGEVNGAGHGLDWFRVGGRDYVVHSNEAGTSRVENMKKPASDTCRPFPRSTALGWGFEAMISDVTDPKRARNVSMLHIAINDPEFCQARKASGRDPWIAYHLIDNPINPKFAAVNFGSAGLRIFDIRKPEKPSEVAYFNHGSPVHAGVGHYDAKRGLIYFADNRGFKVLEFEPQVRARLGL